MNENTIEEWRRLRENFRHWSLHITLCSVPSFYLAYNTNYSSIPSVAAMGTGIAIFIVFYTVLASSTTYRSVTRDPILHKAIRWGTNLRTSISVVGIFGWILGSAIHPSKEAAWIFFAPDLYSGMLAIRIVESVASSWPLENFRVSVLGDDPATRSQDIWLGDINSFFPTLATVLVEGFIISISLVTICFVLAFTLKKFGKQRA